MKKINFFKKKLIKIRSLFPNSNFKDDIFKNDIKPLDEAKSGDLTFFVSVKYQKLALKTKASYCLTIEKNTKFLPPNTKCIVLKNVLF